MSPTDRRRRTAGVVIVGNEILGGKIEERNAAFLIRRFRALGVRLREVAFVEDDRDAIAEAVARLAARCDVVCTSGGVGPTHDDVTVDGVARAFGLPVVEEAAIVATMTRVMKAPPSAGYRRMARVPQGAELVFSERSPWPTVKVRNVYVFPGIPWLLERKFRDVEADIACSLPLWAASFDLHGQEADLCEALDGIVARHPEVEVGSYPRFDGRRWTIRLTLEGSAVAEVNAVRGEIRAAFADRIEAESAPALLPGEAAPRPADAG